MCEETQDYDNGEYYVCDDPIAEFFDPFDEMTPDFSTGKYNDETKKFEVQDKEIPLNEEQQQIAESALQNGVDPTPTLRGILEQMIAESKPQTLEEALPAQIFKINEDQTIFFTDSAFAGPTLRSFQGCAQNKQLKGFIVLPASFVSRLRSRKSNHNTLTPLLYVPQNVLDFAEYFKKQ